MSRYHISAKTDKIAMRMSETMPPKLMPMSARPMHQCLAVVFGFDFALGVWADIYCPRHEAIDGDGNKTIVEEETVSELSTRFNGFSKTHLLELFNEFASEDEKREFQHVLGRCILDLPF